MGISLEISQQIGEIRGETVEAFNRALRIMLANSRDLGAVKNARLRVNGIFEPRDVVVYPNGTISDEQGREVDLQRMINDGEDKFKQYNLRHPDLNPADEEMVTVGD